LFKAVIFDFDGIIADTEPLHLKAFQLTLNEKNIELASDDYYEKYLAYDDKTLFNTLLKERGIEMGEGIVKELMSRKAVHYNILIENNIVLLPGVEDFIKNVSDQSILAIGSGALRHEILSVLEFAGLRDYFKVIVSADEVLNCKPHPEVFVKALKQINETGINTDRISPSECLVVEDSMSGIRAARLAGMKCLAITNSYPEEKLAEADLVKPSLIGFNPREFKELS